MDRPDQRLKAARIASGFKSAAKFAEHLADAHPDIVINDVTYRSHEAPPDQKNHRGFGEKEARVYAPELGVKWSWLLTGDGEPLSGAEMGVDQSILSDAVYATLMGFREFGEPTDEQAQSLSRAVARAYARLKASSEKKTA